MVLIPQRPEILPNTPKKHQTKKAQTSNPKPTIKPTQPTACSRVIVWDRWLAEGAACCSGCWYWGPSRRSAGVHAVDSFSPSALYLGTHSGVPPQKLGICSQQWERGLEGSLNPGARRGSLTLVSTESVAVPWELHEGFRLEPLPLCCKPKPLEL